MLCAADSVLTSFTPTLILLLTRMWVISWQMQLGLFLLLPSLPLWSCFPDSLWAISWQVQLGLFSHPHSGCVGLTDCEWLHGKCSWVFSHCLHSLFGAVGLTACKWFYDRCHWVFSHHFHSHFGPVGLTESESFYGKYISLPSLTLWHCWQQVSGFMAVVAESVLNNFTPTLVLLTWQVVSDFITDATGFVLTSFTLTMVLFSWQQVSDFMASLFSLPICSCWLCRQWVVLCNSYPTKFSHHTPFFFIASKLIYI